MSPPKRQGARGTRLVNGEKRSEQLRATCTPTVLNQIDAIARATGLCRSRATEAVISWAYDTMRDGRVPGTAAESWLSLLEANRRAMVAARDGLDENIARLDTVVFAGSAHLAFGDEG